MEFDGRSVHDSEEILLILVIMGFPIGTAIAAVLIVAYTLFYTPWSFLCLTEKLAEARVLFRPTYSPKSNDAFAEMRTFVEQTTILDATRKAPKVSIPKPYLEGLVKAKELAERKEASRSSVRLGDAPKQVSK
ncbi:hypothetical protein QR680_019282 [Steinernema hermaphroditum]|uniref:Uncharacterized protein n=1 Tax=Steinernema hermaphroditum TaxID=289476 RepID=A0AA39GMW1_9BILA|nr:hypothetical protein QR680_019282 [Steinernema hermaphroditum]